MPGWIETVRRLQIRVLLGATLQDVTKWVSGPISIDKSVDSAVVTASIPMTHVRLPWYAPGSFSAGPQPCQIWARVVTSTDDEWQLVFKGCTESPENSGAIIPSGPLRAVSDSSLWASKPVCLLAAPFAGDTEIEILEALAAANGLVLTVSGSVTGTVIKRPLDFSGITIVDLLKRWGPVFGWTWREADGGVELISHADVAGPSATPLWSLAAGQYYSVTERPPSRPVTAWVITAQEPTLADDGTAITTEVLDASGPGAGVWKTVWIRDITDGVLTQEVMERWEDYVVKGVTNAASDFLKVKEVTTTWTHELNGDSKPTGRLTDKVTVTKTYYSALSSTGTGDPPYTFEDGSFHVDNAESFQETERITESYTWNTSTCALATGEIETKRFLAPLSETSSGDTENAWAADGSNRSQTEETYQVVERLKFREGFWAPGDAHDSDLGTYFGFGTASGRVRYRLEGAERGMESGTNTQFRRNWEQATAWIETPDGTAHQKWTKRWPGSDAAAIRSTDALGLAIGEESGFAGYPYEETREDVPGQIPLPPMDSGVSRLYTMRPILVTVTATSPLPVNVKSEFAFDVESEAMAQRLGKWRLRMDHADIVTAQMPGVPEMKLWDPVEFTDSVRYCTARPGWISSIRLTLDPLSGKCDQQVVVGVDPMPAVGP